MDPLSDVIALLKPSAVVSKPITGRGRWGLRYPAHDAPGFALVLKGRCWVTLGGDAPLALGAGDFLLLPSTPAFTLASHPDAASVPARPSFAPVRHGDPEGEPDFESLGGTFAIAANNAALLIDLLPSTIHVPATEQRSVRLRQMIGLIADECAHDRPGRGMILERLLEVVLVEALRGDGLAGDRAGLLAGLRDPALARALRAMHGDVRARWTVDGLAGIAGQSRSAFAARFSQAVGSGPMEYLARWRMALARDALRAGGRTLDRIADDIGYESASAFSTAFRKRFGCAPGQFARALAAAE